MMDAASKSGKGSEASQWLVTCTDLVHEELVQNHWRSCFFFFLFVLLCFFGGEHKRCPGRSHGLGPEIYGCRMLGSGFHYGTAWDPMLRKQPMP